MSMPCVVTPFLSRKHVCTQRHLKDSLYIWLEWAGFTFDPFRYLDASRDPRLGEYLVGHEVFARVWGDHIAWTFAPAGGGKTALRIAVERACWVGYETNRPFPITYVPPFLEWGHITPSLDEHLHAIAQAAAKTLLIALAYRPHWFLRLGIHERRRVQRALAWNLPGPLSMYLSRCAEGGSPQILQDILAVRPPVHHATDTKEWLAWLRAMAPIEPFLPPPPPSERWSDIEEVLLEILGFPALYLLADGFDAAPETTLVAERVVATLAPLMPLIESWASRRVYFKGFLPFETYAFLSSRFSSLVPSDHVAIIRWTPAGLAEVVRRRVYVASEGMFGSLDAVATSDVRDAEILLAREVAPLPREMLVLTRRVIEEHVERGDVESPLTLEDIETAITWYKTEGKVQVAGVPDVY